MINEQIREIRKTVVFLGKKGEKGIEPFATGFLLRLKNMFHLATAKHVVVDEETGERKDKGMLVLFNSKRSEVAWRPIDQIKEKYKVDWSFHKNPAVDVCIIPFGLDEQNDDVKVVPDDHFLKTEEVPELCDVFFLSYQPGIEVGSKIAPVTRKGMVSRINEDGTLYIDGAAFPGNSGSPVFVRPVLLDQGAVRMSDKLGGRFIGMIGGYVPYREVAYSRQTGHDRVVFEENTGLSKVWPASFVREIV